VEPDPFGFLVFIKKTGRGVSNLATELSEIIGFRKDRSPRRVGSKASFGSFLHDANKFFHGSSSRFDLSDLNLPEIRCSINHLSGDRTKWLTVTTRII